MRRFVLASSTVALALGAGAAAWAQGAYPYGGPGGYQEPPPYGQQGYAEGPAPRLADRLLEDTAALRDRVAREVPPEESDGAMMSMRHLERQAQRFEQSVDSLGPQNEATQAEFGRLANAYARAANAMESLRGYPGVYREFARVQRSMDRLAPMFGGMQHYGYQYANPQGGYQMRGPGLDIDVGGLNFHVRHQ